MPLITMKCPACGANIDMDDSREFGFCSFCGTKIMTDKVIVEHKGSVKVDNSEYVQKCLQNANRALIKEDWEEVEKYYNLVEQNDPDNIEAVFFSSYGKAMLSLTDSDYFKREQKFKVLNKSISIISDYYETTSEDKEKVIKKIAEYIDKMSTTTFVYNRQAANLVGASRQMLAAVGTKRWCVNLIYSTKSYFYKELKEIYQISKDEFLLNLISKGEEEQQQQTPQSLVKVSNAIYGEEITEKALNGEKLSLKEMKKRFYKSKFFKIYLIIIMAVILGITIIYGLLESL